ncbi:hypothetical protein KAI36_02768 [Paenibacillus sp. S02]|nr:hypothetical protein KAI36_02768 [Paenibacillus sp. S02]
MKNTMNSRSNRDARSHMAQETLSILENGYYTNIKQVQVNMAKEIGNAVTGSKLYKPSQLVAVKQEAEQRIKSTLGSSSRIDQQAIFAKMEITGESTCRRHTDSRLKRSWSMWHV